MNDYDFEFGSRGWPQARLGFISTISPFFAPHNIYLPEKLFSGLNNEAYIG